MVTRCGGVFGADPRGGLASPEGRGAQETEQRGETSFWEDEMAGVDWGRRQLRGCPAR